MVSVGKPALAAMSIRTYKWSAVVLLCLVLFLAWQWYISYGQMVAAAFIDGQCASTQESYIDGPRRDPEGLAQQLEFLMAYYDYYSRSLKGSPIARITERGYQRTLTNAVIAFRSWTTNDLGNDPRVWIQKYGN
jgi:hypothetical protein